jgi:hypothetical protein
VTQEILQQALVEHVKRIELRQPLAQHRLEAIGEEMHGMENGKTIHDSLEGLAIHRRQTLRQNDLGERQSR